MRRLHVNNRTIRTTFGVEGLHSGFRSLTVDLRLFVRMQMKGQIFFEIFGCTRRRTQAVTRPHVLESSRAPSRARSTVFNFVALTAAESGFPTGVPWSLAIDIIWSRLIILTDIHWTFIHIHDGHSYISHGTSVLQCLRRLKC